MIHWKKPKVQSNGAGEGVRSRHCLKRPSPRACTSCLTLGSRAGNESLSTASRSCLEAKLDTLQQKLRATEGQLTMAELQKAVAELKVLTNRDDKVIELTAELHKASAASSDALIEVAELRAGIDRRDEQIAFLMQVFAVRAAVGGAISGG